MCLLFLALKKNPDYKLIIAGNRDEFYNRKTAAAAFWNEYPFLLAGRDLEAMGTWQGITKNGKVSMLTNYRDPANINPAAPSRGMLVLDFLTGDIDGEKYLQGVERNGSAYNGFNLIAGDVNKLWYYSNYGIGIRQLEEGYFGLSNHLLDTPWPKVATGKARFIELVNKSNLDPEAYFDLLYNVDPAPDHLLPNTGLSLDRERALSSIFIKTPGYGSRSTSLILVDNQNIATFIERVYNVETFAFTTQTFTFRIEGLIFGACRKRIRRRLF